MATMFVGQRFEKMLNGHPAIIEIIGMSPDEVLLTVSGEHVHSTVHRPHVMPLSEFVRFDQVTRSPTAKDWAVSLVGCTRIK